MTYDDAVRYLHTLPRFSDQGAVAFAAGLDRMEALLAAMGDPHRAFAAVHVAGTNGKGSVASLLAAIGTAAGLRMGLHTSPHLVHLRERLRIDGTPAPESWIAEAVARFREVFDATRPSFFEATTALGFLYFAEEDVDFAVVEVGLGGRLDATNVLQPRLAVITHVGLDHTDLLGDTLAQVAREKAGIIKPNTPVLTAVDAPEALGVLREVAADRAAPLHELRDEVELHDRDAGRDGLTLTATTPRRRYEGLRVGLAGRHQATNALLALRAAEYVFPEETLTDAALRTGLRDVRRLAGLRGRLEVVQEAPLMVADVAHNPDGLAVALRFMQEVAPPDGTLYVLLALMRDKDVQRVGRLLAAARARVYAVALESPRALPVAELQALLEAGGVPVVGTGPAKEGLAWVKQHARGTDTVLVTGSHQVVGHLLRTTGV